MTKTANEFYPTPAWCVHRIIENLTLPRGRWLEPCVGYGAICDAVYLPSIRWTKIDIADTGYQQIQGDYLAMDASSMQKFAACIMNPPFSRAVEFATQAMKHCRVVVMLQRMNWLASESRNEWLRANTPSVYVLPNRPSFINGTTDNQEYAWFVWGDQNRHHPVISVLPNTPVEERKLSAREYYDRRQTTMF
jgi:hypothetical protein